MKLKENPVKEQHCHDGHRERLRERFLNEGLENFQPHEVLELLLQYAQPRHDTNPLAHKLIHEFQTFHGVVESDFESLIGVKGISAYTATLLKMIPEICKYYSISRAKALETLDSMQKLQEYVRAKLQFEQEEQILLLCLDESLQLLYSKIIAVGTTRSVKLDPQAIVACAMQKRSSRVVLAHNHPHATADFSSADLFSTNQLRRILEEVQIELLDHIVVGMDGKITSLHQTFVL